MPFHQTCPVQSRTDRLIVLAGRFTADNLNKAKNLCSKTIGEKMKVDNRWAPSAPNQIVPFCLLAQPVYLPSSTLVCAVHPEKGACWGRWICTRGGTEPGGPHGGDPVGTTAAPSPPLPWCWIKNDDTQLSFTPWCSPAGPDSHPDQEGAAAGGGGHREDGQRESEAGGGALRAPEGNRQPAARLCAHQQWRGEAVR